MTYNMTQLQASTTVFKLFEYANDATGEILVGLFMIGIFFILLLSMKRMNFEYALFASSGLAFVLSAILTYSKLLNFIIPLIFLIVMALSGFYLYTTQN